MDREIRNHRTSGGSHCDRAAGSVGRREEGSALLPAMIMIIMIGGMCMAMQMTSLSTQRAARISHDLQRSATVRGDTLLGLQEDIASNVGKTKPACRPFQKPVR